MKKVFGISFLLMLSFSQIVISSTFAKDCSPKDIQHFILIHGIGANPDSFGAMKRLIPKHIECAKAYNFKYDTKNSKLSVPDFAKSLNNLIKNLPRGKKDLNFLMHSQGGLIGLNWLIHSFHNEGEFQLDYANRINHFISFSTPFWGSDFALMGEKTFFNLGVDENPLSPFGKKQLVDMQYGSLQYQWQLKELVDDQEFAMYLKNNIKMLNIVGITPDSNEIASSADFYQTQFFEGDLIVNTPSMKLNFLYVHAPLKYESNKIDILSASRMEFGGHVYVKGMHVDVIPGVGGVGVVDVPKKCTNLNECDHDGFKAFLNFVKDEKMNDDHHLSNLVHGFESHVQVSLTNSNDLENVKLKIKKFNPDELSLSLYRGHFFTYKPVNISKDAAYFVIKGSLNSHIEEGGFEIELTHSSGLKRNIIVNIQKDTLTHIKVNL